MGIILKRVLLILAAVFVLLISSIYLLIPDTLTIRNEIIVGCSAQGANRTINTNWKEIFRQASSNERSSGAYQYTLIKPLYNGSRILIQSNIGTDTSTLSLLPVSSDTTIFQWNLSRQTGSDPISKLTDYISMLALKKDILAKMIYLKGYVDKTTNVYGYNITHITLTDTILVSTEMVENSYPTTKDIYILIQRLQKYISTNGAKETNYPMLNISVVNNKYSTMVGIPINKSILPDNEIKIKRLIPIQNKILTTQVVGDTSKIKEAYQKIELYMQDHFLSSPVIPYELIITDRSKQPDSTKWVTRIMYPIA